MKEISDTLADRNIPEFFVIRDRREKREYHQSFRAALNKIRRGAPAPVGDTPALTIGAPAMERALA